MSGCYRDQLSINPDDSTDCGNLTLFPRFLDRKDGSAERFCVLIDVEQILLGGNMRNIDTLETQPPRLVVLATASLRSLDLYRSGQRLATIPNPTGNTSTKVSGWNNFTP